MVPGPIWPVYYSLTWCAQTRHYKTFGEWVLFRKRLKQTDNILCDFEDFSPKFAVYIKFLIRWFLFCCFFLCALKAFMETQCLHFRFPSTRGKQISKSDTSSSYETSRHLFLFLWTYIYKIYVNIYCIMYVHTHIHIHMYVCMLKFSSTQQMVGEFICRPCAKCDGSPTC